MDLPTALHTLFIFWVGLSLGSFASLLAYRWPRGMRWTVARSQCPACGHALGPRDLVPLFSWLLSGGKCRYCKAAVSKRYPLLEITAAAMALSAYAAIGWHWPLIPVLCALPFAMAYALMRLWPGRG